MTPPPLEWPATYVGRLEAWSQITQLNADLLSHDSATATLQAWCDQHGGGHRILARRVRGGTSPPLPKTARPSASAWMKPLYIVGCS